MSERVLVCGGRDFFGWAILYAILDDIKRGSGIEVIIHGAAPGADRLAGQWAKDRRVDSLVFPADWERHGKRAGPIRNQEMLSKGKPTLGLCMPGGNGTRDMRERLILACINTMVYFYV